MVADTFNSLVHILLPDDDATMLLEALNVKPTTISKQQQVPVQTPAAGMAYTHPTLLRYAISPIILYVAKLTYIPVVQGWFDVKYCRSTAS
jgi:cyanate lyase